LILFVFVLLYQIRLKRDYLGTPQTPAEGRLPNTV